MVQTAKKYYTFEDYLNYEDDTDYKYELVNGELIQMPVASGIHALIVTILFQLLTQEILRLNLDWLIMPGTLGVRTTETKSRIPDLTIITRKQAEEIRTLRSAVLQESPLLVIEIASPGNSDDDYRYKRSEYAALEIPEYWIVDPTTEKISVLTLINGFYEVAEFTSDSPIISPTFPELKLNVTQIFNF
jgi:Uma2 family endonuclease